MRPPFMRLRALLLALVGAETVARFVDPLLGDVHAEFEAARTTEERRRVFFRGLALLLRLVPHVLQRPANGSLLWLGAPLSALALLGVVALLRSPSLASLAVLQLGWLALGWAFALLCASLAGGKHGAHLGSAVAIGLLGLSMTPYTHADSARLYTTLGLPFEPLKLAVPFVLLPLLSPHARLRGLGSLLLAGSCLVASARGALGDACFGITALAVLLDARTRWVRLVAPLAIVASFARVAPTRLAFDAHTDGMLRTLLMHGGYLGGLLATALAVWTVSSFVRCQGPDRRVALSIALGFGVTVALAVLASDRLLPYEVASVIGLSYGGSGLFMLFGAAGALAGSTRTAGGRVAGA